MNLSPDKQFDFAERAVSQVIALASAILVLSVTFAHDWATSIGNGQKWLLRGSWILMVISILGGLMSLLALSGMARSNTGDIMDKELSYPWRGQIVAFLVGLVLMVWLGLTLL